MKRIIFIPIIIFCVLMQIGCEKYANDYKKYLEDKEIVYPGLARDVRYQAGYLRTKLIWNPSPDPNISHYLIEWNNGTKSQEVAAKNFGLSDSIETIIPNLPEYVYSFTITAFDKENNKSIGQQIHNVRVYGAGYQAILLNRLPNAEQPYDVDNAGELRIRFNVSDSMNVTTKVMYENNSGQKVNVFLAAKENQVVLPNYKYGTAIQYRSGYAPEANAFDTLYTVTDAVFPTVYRAVDKSQFKALTLAGDAGSAWSWELPYIWNNSYDEPGFHTSDLDMPISFTIDMGKKYALAKLKMWQRISAAYNSGNPRKFEVWGSNNPTADGSWASWTKLEAFTMEKPSGQSTGNNTDEDIRIARSGHEFEFPTGTGEFRYIRFRITETWGKTNYVHLIEISPFSLK